MVCFAAFVVTDQQFSM